MCCFGSIALHEPTSFTTDKLRYTGQLAYSEAAGCEVSEMKILAFQVHECKLPSFLSQYPFALEQIQIFCFV
jgi:hypothetical protein